MENQSENIRPKKIKTPKKPKIDKKNEKKIRARELRLPYVAQLYAKGYNLTQIQAMIKKNLNLRTYSLSTVYSDRNIILEEWKKERVHDVEANVNEKLAAAKLRNVKLWESYDRTYNVAALAEVRHNDEFAADLLQLGKNTDSTDKHTVEIKVIVNGQQSNEVTDLLSKLPEDE